MHHELLVASFVRCAGAVCEPPQGADGGGLALNVGQSQDAWPSTLALEIRVLLDE